MSLRLQGYNNRLRHRWRVIIPTRLTFTQRDYDCPKSSGLGLGCPECYALFNMLLPMWNKESLSSVIGVWLLQVRYLSRTICGYICSRVVGLPVPPTSEINVLAGICMTVNALL